MDLLTAPVPLRDALGFTEVLRRLGFTADEIKMHFQLGHVYVVLDAQGEQFCVPMTPDPEVPDYATFLELWPQAAAAWNTASEEVCTQIFQAFEDGPLQARGGVVELLMALQRKGIRAPRRPTDAQA